jgi:hypothetical protein
MHPAQMWINLKALHWRRGIMYRAGFDDLNSIIHLTSFTVSAFGWVKTAFARG